MFGGGGGGGGSAIPGFGQPAIFGQNTNSVNRNPFALPGSVTDAVSTGNPFAVSSSPAANSTDFRQTTNSSTFGSGSMLGQGSYTNKGNSFSRGARFGTTSPFDTSSANEAGMFSGNSTGVFGGSSGLGTMAFAPSVATNPFGPGSTFGQNSTGLSRGNPGSGTAAFAPGFATNPFGSGSTFRQNSIGVFGRTPGSGTTSFAPSFATNSFGTGSTFGQNSTGVFGRTPGSGNTSFAPTAAPNAFGSGSIFGQNSSGVFRGSPCSRTTASAPSVVSTFPAFGTNSSLSTGAVGPVVGGGTVGSVPSNSTTLAPSAPERSIFIQANPVSYCTNPFGITAGPQTRSPFTMTRASSEKAKYHLMRQGSGGKYVLTDAELGPRASGKLISISGTADYQKKSHEELRFEDYQLSVDEGLKSAATLGPATVSSPWSQTSTAPNEAQTSSTPSTFTFPVQSGSSTGKGLWNQLPLFKPSLLNPHNKPQKSSTPSTFTFPVQSEPSNREELCKQLPLFKPPLLNPVNEPRTSSTPSTFTFPVHSEASKVPPAGTGLLQPESVVAFQITQTTPASHAIMNKIFEQPPLAGTLNQNQNSGMKQFGQTTNTITTSVVASPFGEKNTFRDSQISAMSVQLGISSISISVNPTPVSRVSKLTARNLTLGRVRPSFGKYKPNDAGQKVPFFEQISSGTSKAATSLMPRQNPRDWVLKPSEEGVLETKTSKTSWMESEVESGNSNDSDNRKHGSGSSAECKINIKDAWVASAENGEFQDTVRNKTNEVLTPKKYAAGVKELVPKVQSLDYYIIPSTDELVAKERVEPGFCCHVKDFVVGRKGFGCIKFLGETDVRNLDLESVIKFNNREVIVYMDEGEKPEVGKGLNKPAEISLLNVKCTDKGTGKQYVDGPKVDKWRKMLIKKAEEQGTKFVSYDPVKGEWKFRVRHF